MATIQSAIKLNDMMSEPIRSITNAMNMMLSSWQSLEGSTSKGLDIGEVESIRSELNKATQALDDMGDEQREFNREVQNGSNALSDITSKIAGMVGAFVGLNAIKNTLTSAIEYSSDLAEVQNVVDVAFGESSNVINAWSQTTLEAFGLNELSAKQFAGTMGAMLKSSGLTGDAVTRMSMSIAELAGDMASFYNLSGEEAFDKLRAGISGETEPLKQLGINMSVANLEAYALSQGIKKSYDQMSQAQQVWLRYNYLMQATADAQGDFARTSDSFSNQQKLLTENWKDFTGEIVSGLLPALSVGIGALNSAIGWMSENWSVLQPIVLGVAAALGVYATAMGICAIQSGIHAAATAVKAASEMMATGATFAATAAQHGFNAALLACPITWIILAIIAVIAIIYAVIAAINKVQGTTISATGVIMGALAAAGAFIWNLFLGLVDLALAAVNYIANPWIAFANFFGNLFNDPIASIIHLFGDMADNILGVIENIAKALDKVFGSNLASAVSGWRSGLDEMVETAANKHGNGSYEKIANELNLSSESLGLSRWAYSDAYNTGYNWGAGVEDSVSGFFSGSETETGNYDELLAGLNGLPTFDELAGNTKGIKDSLDITHEDLKYLRDIAERDAINRFTTAEISVNMGGVNNTVNSNMDLDGVMDYMVTGINEAMERAAEGVHS